LTTIVPCVTFGQIAEVMDEGEMSMFCFTQFETEIRFFIKYDVFNSKYCVVYAACPLGTFMYLLMMPALCSHWVMGSKYREKMRRKFNLVEAPYSDCASHVLCPCCSLCQEYRELKIRNLDPSLGTNSKRQIQIYIYGPGILFDISVQVW